MRLPPPYDRMLAPVYVPSLLMSVSQEAALILLPLHVLEIGGGAALAAVVVGLRGIGMLLFDVPAGLLAARFGDKPLLAGGLAAMMAAMLVLAAAPGLWAVAIGALLLGVGNAAWMLGRQSYIAQVCASAEVGRAIAGMAGLQRVGTFIGPAAGGLVAASAGYAAAFAAGAACGVVAGVFVLLFARDVTQPAAADTRLGAVGTVLRAHRREFSTAGLAALALQLMRATRQLLVPLFGRSIGLDPAAIGLLYSASAAIDMSLFYPVGVLVDRRGRKWSAVPSMTLFALGLALLPLAQSFLGLLAVVMLLGLANGLGTGIVMIIGADLASASGRRGQFLGVWRLIGDVGMSGAPLLAGALVQLSGLALASAAAAGIGLAGALVMLFLVTETLDLTEAR
ncbi:MAG TPA: MFS transporter [Gammaproteobacteria bacterium]